MALKDLIVRSRGKPIPPARTVLSRALLSCGVRAPISTADILLAALRREGYRIIGGPRT